ncbi:MAG: asparagine synthetase B, partial [Candidatus Neomarinimicrobiota bacterium]|nr:asparagine synthetase B [Candidatus Neomarinimicrobiota bacterium]
MKKIILTLFLTQFCFSQKILIPMDALQKDHLKAYGSAFWVIKEQINVEWILNYRGGSFMMDYYQKIEQECRVRGVTYELIGAEETLSIYNEV